MKQCRGPCGETKADDCFPRNKNTSDGLHSYCSKCKSKKDVESRRKTRQQNRNLKKYGLYMTDDQIKAIVDQGVFDDPRK